jgi:hypothetical protein
MGADPFCKLRSVFDQVKRDKKNEDDPNNGGDNIFYKGYRLTDNRLD